MARFMISQRFIILSFNVHVNMYTKPKKETSPVFKCSCSVIKKLKMSNDIHIFGRTIMCPIKQSFNSKESILQKKPDESDFHVHALTSRVRVYFLKPFSIIL